MQRYGLMVGVGLLFLVFGYVVASIDAEAIVAYVGIERAPLIMLVLGLLGGLSTFTGIPYHLILMGLAAGGGTPWLLGLATAGGVMLGDSVTYVWSRQAKGVVTGRVGVWLAAVASTIATRPRLLTPGLVLYGSLSPFSNDFMVASLTLMGYSYRRIIIPLTVGNTLYNIALAYLGYYFYDAVVGWL